MRSPVILEGRIWGVRIMDGGAAGAGRPARPGRPAHRLAAAGAAGALIPVPQRDVVLQCLLPMQAILAFAAVTCPPYCFIQVAGAATMACRQLSLLHAYFFVPTEPAFAGCGHTLLSACCCDMPALSMQIYPHCAAVPNPPYPSEVLNPRCRDSGLDQVAPWGNPISRVPSYAGRRLRHRGRCRPRRPPA